MIQRLLLVVTFLVGFHASLPSAQDAPALTEVERLKLEVITLQEQLARALAEKSDCQATLGPLQAQAHSQSIDRQLQLLKIEIEKNHPGFEFTPQSGSLTKRPDPKKE